MVDVTESKSTWRETKRSELLQLEDVGVGVELEHFVDAYAPAQSHWRATLYVRSTQYATQLIATGIYEFITDCPVEKARAAARSWAIGILRQMADALAATEV